MKLTSSDSFAAALKHSSSSPMYSPRRAKPPSLPAGPITVKTYTYAGACGGGGGGRNRDGDTTKETTRREKQFSSKKRARFSFLRGQPRYIPASTKACGVGRRLKQVDVVHTWFVKRNVFFFFSVYGGSVALSSLLAAALSSPLSEAGVALGGETRAVAPPGARSTAPRKEEGGVVAVTVGGIMIIADTRGVVRMGDVGFMTSPGRLTGRSLACVDAGSWRRRTRKVSLMWQVVRLFPFARTVRSPGMKSTPDFHCYSWPQPPF